MSNWSSDVSFRRVLLLSALFRLCLVAYGEWQDRHFAVKFTDVDYHVFSDAAKHVTEGRSPFERPTYRYTPLLAVILTLNHYLFFSFGKLLFVACDLATGVLIHSVLALQGVDGRMNLVAVSAWLLNPLTATVSSRGNAESLLSVLVLSVLYLLLSNRPMLSAALFGLAVHLKIFPIIYSLPLYLFLDANYPTQQNSTANPTRKSSNRNILRCFLSPLRLKYTATSVAVFMAATLLCYIWCGERFIQEAYLYHVTRRDTRHNFSVYFYMLYLVQDSWLSFPLGLAAFLPQLVLVATTAICLYRDINFCCFVQTFIFVTFNKVCTSQYFLWYLCLLPLILPFTRLTLYDGVVMGALWFLGQAVWLASAYCLEFLGFNSFFLIWLSGLAFFFINIALLFRIIRNHSFRPVFVEGTLIHTKQQ